MKKEFKQVCSTSVFSSLCFIIMGLFLFFKSEETIEIISYVLGGFIIALGILSFVRYFKYREERKFSFDIVYGIVSILLGFILICNPHAIAKIIPIILGVWITISGVLKIQMSLQIKSYNSNMWKGTLIIGLIALLCGIILIFNPFQGAVVITKIIGIFLIVYAILDIVLEYTVNKMIKTSFEIIKK